MIEVVPRARDPPSDPESDTESPESHEDEVKRILHNTSQFIENVLGAYNEMLDSDAKAKSKEKIHKEIKRFMKLRKQASPSHVERESVKKLADDLDRDLTSFLRVGALCSKNVKATEDKTAMEEDEAMQKKILQNSDNILERISSLFDEGSGESGAFQEGCQQFKNSTEADFNNL